MMSDSVRNSGRQSIMCIRNYRIQIKDLEYERKQEAKVLVVRFVDLQIPIVFVLTVT